IASRRVRGSHDHSQSRDAVERLESRDTHLDLNSGRRWPVSRCTVECLESRRLFANYTAATTSELIADINVANQTPEADTITLVAGNTFSLTAADNFTVVDNFTCGATGLPVIAPGGGALVIVGNGDKIERSTAAGTPAFRLFDVAAGASLTLKN